MGLEFRNVSKSFGGHPAVQALSLTVEAGDFVGLIGPNGAGKTTTLRMGVGHLAPSSGEVLIDGMPVLDHPLEARRRIGYVPEYVALYDYLTGAEYLEFAAELKGLDTTTRNKEIALLLEMLELGEERSRLIRTYSQGMRRKVAMAGALLGSPPYLVLDEAMNGLDPTTMHRLKAHLKALVDQGMAILISSHVLEVLERLCNRIAIMHAGTLVDDMDADRLRQVRSDPGGLEQYFMRCIGQESALEAGRETSGGLARPGREEL